MAQKEPERWITVNGRHIPVYEGETKDQAVNRYIAKQNEETKEKQIAKHKEQADKLNGKTTDTEKKIAELQKQYDEAKSIFTKADIKTEIEMLKADWKGTKEEWEAHQETEHQKRVQESLARQKAEKEKREKEQEAKRKQLEEELRTQPKDKVEQYKIIQEHNPMLDDYHTGIRKPSDIKTWKEVIDEDKKDGESFSWGDFSRADGEKALKTGKITIYSSYPIKQGVFVSTSRVQSEEYAGGKGKKVYSKTIPLSEVAWISGDEGQYAKLRG